MVRSSRPRAHEAAWRLILQLAGVPASEGHDEPHRGDDHRGCESNDGPDVIRVALPPVIGMVYRSPSSSNTIVLPSGETSSDIHVASDVSKLTVRAIFNGSESSLTFVVSRFVVSWGGGGGGC